MNGHSERDLQAALLESLREHPYGVGHAHCGYGDVARAHSNVPVDELRGCQHCPPIQAGLPLPHVHCHPQQSMPQPLGNLSPPHGHRVVGCLSLPLST